MGSHIHTPPSYLVPLAGPEIQAVELDPRREHLTIGRHENCEIPLPPNAETVSRFHAKLRAEANQWRISDLKSRWGTFVNGMKLAPEREVLLTEGDLIRISPWTFCFSARKTNAGTDSVNDLDTAHTLVRTVTQDQAGPLADQLLNLLLESSAAIHAATEEKALAEVILDVACQGSGLPNGALLRPLDATGRIAVIAARTGSFKAGQPVYSRSLLRAASTGAVAEFAGDHEENLSESIVAMKITSAICAPLMVGNTVAAYLYLDSRGAGGSQTLRSHASAFCMALARMSGLALANLKRVEMERRQASLEAELSAGGEAQKWILPKRSNSFPPFSYLGESRPGQYVGGDFFDIVPLGEGKLAVALGDVTGKGISASVLMTATQGFLHAALEQHHDVAKAVNALNRFVSPRCPDTRFVTLWVGLLDTGSNTLTYVDAGHGYAAMAHPDGRFLLLTSELGPPIGIDGEFVYEQLTVPLLPGAIVLVVSDGIIEQPAPQPDITGVKPCFEVEGVKRTILTSLNALAARNSDPTATSTGDPIASLYEAVIQHAGSNHLADDATAVLVRW